MQQLIAYIVALLVAAICFATWSWTESLWWSAGAGFAIIILSVLLDETLRERR